MRNDDFANMIAGLQAAGVSRSEIAKACQVSRMTVWRLAEGVGKEPKWSTGRELEQLYFSRAVTPMLQKKG